MKIINLSLILLILLVIPISYSDDFPYNNIDGKGLRYMIGMTYLNATQDVCVGSTCLSSGTGGATDFLGLTDTPDSYSGQSGKAVRVNSTENGLEFFTASGSGTVTSIEFTEGLETTGANPITASVGLLLTLTQSTNI